MKFILSSIFILSTFICINIFAAAPKLDLVTQKDIDDISKEFSANFFHTGVSGAASLGQIWGVEVGVIAGITQTPKFEALVKRASPTEKIDMIPHAGVFLSGSVPFGITIEAKVLPEIKASNMRLTNNSAAVKWTITNVFFDKIPLDIAVKAHFATSKLSYTQKINNASSSNIEIDSTITFKNKIFGAMAFASKNFLFVEPYAGIGFLKGDSDLTVSAVGTATIFNTTLSASSAQSASSKPSSAHLVAGVSFNIFIVKIAAEYANAFDTNRYTAKVSLYF